MGQERTIRKGL